MFIASIAGSIIWAFGYIILGNHRKFCACILLLIGNIHHTGYDDITPGDNWRLLASFEAANGIIIFGWSTAIVMAVVQMVYFTKK